MFEKQDEIFFFNQLNEFFNYIILWYDFFFENFFLLSQGNIFLTYCFVFLASSIIIVIIILLFYLFCYLFYYLFENFFFKFFKKNSKTTVIIDTPLFVCKNLINEVLIFIFKKIEIDKKNFNLLFGVALNILDKIKSNNLSNEERCLYSKVIYILFIAVNMPQVYQTIPEMHKEYLETIKDIIKLFALLDQVECSNMEKKEALEKSFQELLEKLKKKL